MVLEMTYPELAKAVNPTHDIKLFAGRSNTKLAQEIADYLGTTVGPMVVKNFADGEIYVQVKESVRGDDVFIVQPLCNPVNENLVELLIIIDAFKRASAKTITAVIPYYGYARQDRKTSGREAITAKLVADLLTTAGADRVLAMDLHTGQIQGFFNILVDHIFATPILVDYVKGLHIPQDDMVIVSTGVRPNVDIAKEAGIELGATGAIRVNSRMKTNIADIYACGDCVEKINMISNSPMWFPLGSTANKEGRVAAINACGGVEDFEGILGSAVLRYRAMAISMTGLTEKAAQKLGYDTVSVVITKRDKAGYMPEVKNVTLKLVADRRSHKVLGAQAIGDGDADKRVNTISIGLLSGMRVEDLLDVDLTYAPPFSTSIDILISAARILKSKLN